MQVSNFEEHDILHVFASELNTSFDIAASRGCGNLFWERIMGLKASPSEIGERIWVGLVNEGLLFENGHLMCV